MTDRASSSTSLEIVEGQAPSATALHELAGLQQAVLQAMDRKRRLGQYAVVWQGADVETLLAHVLPALPGGAVVESASWPMPEPVQMLVVQEPAPRS